MAARTLQRLQAVAAAHTRLPSSRPSQRLTPIQSVRVAWRLQRVPILEMQAVTRLLEQFARPKVEAAAEPERLLATQPDLLSAAQVVRLLVEWVI